MAMAFNPDGSLANNKPSTPKQKTLSNRVSSVDEWNNIGTNYMKNYYVDQYKNIASKDYNTQLDIVNKLRSYDLINEQQRKDLQMGIIYNDRIAKGQGTNAQQLNISPFQQMVKDLGLQNVPVIKSVVKPFMPPESDINTTVKNNENLIGVTPAFQKYINDLGQTVINTKGQEGVQQYNDALKQAEKISKNNLQTTTFIKDPASYITTFNKMDSLGQRSVINDLTNTIRDYKNSTDKELRDLADKSTVLLGYLTGSKQNIEEYNKALKLESGSVPEVKNRKDVITFALNTGRDLIGTAKDFANIVDQSIRANVNQLWAKTNRTKLLFNPDLQPFITDKWTNNLNAYKSGQIDKRTYELNNARMNDWFERSIGSDTSAANRWAKSVGWAAYGASFVIPSSKFLSGGQFILKEMLGDVIGNATLNSLSTLSQYSKDRKLTATDYATNFVLGGLFAATPYIYHAIKTGVIRAKIGRLPGGEEFAAKLDTAADQGATSKNLVEAFGGTEDPQLKAAALEAVDANITEKERVELNKNIKTAISDATDVVNELNTNVNLEGVTTQTATTTPVTTAVTTETPTVSAQIAEEINAKKNIYVEDTGTKVGNAKEFRIVDTNGKNLGVIKANTIQAASARLKQIQESPTRYSKQYPKVFETPKQRVVETAKVTKEKVSAPKPTPTAVKRPNFMPEAYTVLEKERTLPNGKLTREFVLRDAQGREIRRLTTSEIRTYREYTKARVEAFKASQATGKAQTKLEAARAEAQAATAQARADAKKVAVDNLRERPAIKNGKGVIETIDSEGNVVKTTVLYDKNKEGKTYTVYRGSGEGKKVTTEYGLSILGNDKKYYAFTEDVAKKFGNKVEKTEVTLRNPIEITNDAQWREISNAAGNKFSNPTGLSKAETQQWIANIDRYLKSKGYDGVVIRFAKGKDTTLIRRVFGDEQIVPFGAAPKAPVTTIATEMGKQKPTVIKEAQVVKVEVPAKPKPEPAPAPAMPTPPKTKETITKGAARTVMQDIEAGYRTNYPDQMATFESLKGQIKDKLIPKYEQDIINNIDHVIDVITGRKLPENNVQQQLYTVLLQNYLQKGGDAKTWRKINNSVNIAGAPAHKAASEAGQNLSALSLVEQKYDINSIINRIEKERITDKKAFFQARGTSYEQVLSKEREVIVKNIPEVTTEDNIKLIQSYKEKKFGPLLKAFAEGKINLKEFSIMTPDRRLSVLTGILKDEDLALKYASDFEKKLLLKNQKLGLINWLKSDIKMDPNLKKDIIAQVLELDNVLDPNNAGKFDNFINTKLGLRLTGVQQEKLFELSNKVRESEAGIIKEYGKAENRLKAAANLVDTKLGGKKVSWERTKADYAYGEALADTMLYLRDVQAKGFIESLKELRNIQGTKAGYQALKDINDTMRALQSSLDNSFLLRQGMQTLKTDPAVWLKSARMSYEAIANAMKDPIKAEKTFMTYILSDPWAEVGSRNGLAVMTKDDIFSPAIDPSNIRGVGRTYKASALAYDTAAQVQRLELFKKFYTVDMLNLEKMNAKEIAKRAKDSNFTKLEMPKDYPKNLATYINALTGRGTLGGLEPSARTLNLWFYSTRFLASQLQKMVAHPLGATIGGVTIRNEAGKLFWNPVHKRASANLMKIAITTAAMMGIANALKPGSAELDPRSADFGKIKIGNTRFDITGGMGQFIVLLARTLPTFLPGIDAYTKNSNTGLLTKLNSQEYGSKDAFDVVMEFFQNKTSPLARNFITQLKGVDVNRMRPSLGNKLEDVIQPMVIGNFRELISDKPSSVMQKFIAALLDVHGLAANTYAGAGQGSRGASWEISNAQDILAFKKQVGEQEFRKAAQKADDKFNALILKLLEDTDYKKANSDTKTNIIRLAKAQIQKDIFNEYKFKYKPEVMSKTERQIQLNLINRNL